MNRIVVWEGEIDEGGRFGAAQYRLVMDTRAEPGGNLGDGWWVEAKRQDAMGALVWKDVQQGRYAMETLARATMTHVVMCGELEKTLYALGGYQKKARDLAKALNEVDQELVAIQAPREMAAELMVEQGVLKKDNEMLEAALKLDSTTGYEQLAEWAASFIERFGNAFSKLVETYPSHEEAWIAIMNVEDLSEATPESVIANELRSVPLLRSAVHGATEKLWPPQQLRYRLGKPLREKPAAGEPIPVVELLGDHAAELMDHLSLEQPPEEIGVAFFTAEEFTGVRSSASIVPVADAKNYERARKAWPHPLPDDRDLCAVVRLGPSQAEAR